MNADLLKSFNQLCIANRLPPLSADQLEMLVSARSTAWAYTIVQKVQENDADALEKLTKWCAATRLTTSIQDLGFPLASLPMVIGMVQAHGMDYLSNLTATARNDKDPQSRPKLERIIKLALSARDMSAEEQQQGSGANEGGDDSTDGSRGRTGSQDRPSVQSNGTRLAPQSRKFSQMPPPPGTRTSAARSSAPAGSTSHSSVPPRGTVTPIDQARNQQRNQAHSSYRQADQPDFEDSAYSDQRGDRDTQQAGQDSPAYDNDQATAFNRGSRGSAVRFQKAVDNRHEKVRHVVYVECAEIRKDGSNTYNWQDKLVLLLNQFETEQILCVMHGKIPMARFTAHGADKKRWIQVSNQDPATRYAGGVQVSAGDGKRQFICTIYPTHLTEIKMVLLRAYRAMMKIDSDVAALSLLATVATNYALYAVQNPPDSQQGRGNGQRPPERSDRNEQGRGDDQQRYGNHRS